MDNFDILKSIQKSEQELRDLIEGRDQKALDEGNRLRYISRQLNQEMANRLEEAERNSLKNQQKLTELKNKHAQLLARLEHDKNKNISVIERLKAVNLEYAQNKKRVESDTGLSSQDKKLQLEKIENLFQIRTTCVLSHQ